MKEELHFETLKSNKKTQLIILFAFIILFGLIFFKVSMARYQNAQSIPLAKGIINYTPPDFTLMALFTEDENGEYVEASSVPSSGYTLNSTSYCTIPGETEAITDSSIIMEYADGALTFGNITKKGTRCYLYFDLIKDTTAPTISNVASSVTKTSIEVTVTASDDTGVAKYYYSINNGAYTSSTTNTYTFSGLSAGTSYTIKVYVEDAAGNASTVNTQEISTTPNGQTASTILAGLNKLGARSSFSSVLTTDPGGVYSAEDDDGTSYYYAGAASNNYVQFAGFYWRIIRFNGDGSIRLIYDGTSARANGTSSTDTQTGTSAFNSSYNNNMYVGFMYTSGNAHGTGTTSTILTTLNTWYDNNLSSYASYIDSDAGFCNDRTPSTSSSSSNGSGGTGTTTTYYGAFIRLITNKAPTLKCASSSDLFTVSTSTRGNKALTNPIGLITADEVAFAGGVYNTSNSSYYLYTGQNYWTLSPSCAFAQGVFLFVRVVCAQL